MNLNHERATLRNQVCGRTRSLMEQGRLQVHRPTVLIWRARLDNGPMIEALTLPELEDAILKELSHAQAV